MRISHVHVFSFSPCGGTRRVAGALAPGFGLPVSDVDVTRPLERTRPRRLAAGHLAVFAFPVFGGRLPRGVAEELFEALEGDGTPAVLAAVYGNRDYEDALLEMQRLAEDRGFIVVAAVAAVAEHSMAAELAAGRPDDADAASLAAFARATTARLLDAGGAKDLRISVPGVFPFRKQAMNLPMGPEVSEACTACGTCAGVCPTAAISPESPNATLADVCIACQACVKYCPEGARAMNQPRMQEARAWLRGNFITPRREADFFPAPAAG